MSIPIKDAKLSGAPDLSTITNAGSFRDALGANSGVWPVSLGGTGASTVAGALTALGLFAPIGASLAKTVNQTIASGGQVLLTWESARWDDATFFSNATDALVIPVTGRYLISAAILGEQADWRVRLYKNGVELIGLARASGDRTAFTGVVELSLAATDYLQLYAEQYSGIDRDIVSGEGTRFTIHRTK